MGATTIFELGGSSILLIQLHMRLQEAFFPRILPSWIAWPILQ
ncbi:acyl carrier protein [Paenibacillus rhizoplanae]